MRQIIDSTRLSEWFNPWRRDAQEVLPQLVRKLIVATVPTDSLATIRIPAGDDILLPGFDGRVETLSGNLWVPEGLSVWEMGTGDPSRKAAEDYAKRSADEQLLTQSTMTLHIPAQDRLPFDQKTTETRSVGDRRISTGWSLDHHTRTLDDAEVTFRDRGDSWLTVTATRDSPIMPDWPGLICHALEFGTARRARPRHATLGPRNCLSRDDRTTHAMANR